MALFERAFQRFPDTDATRASPPCGIATLPIPSVAEDTIRLEAKMPANTRGWSRRPIQSKAGKATSRSRPSPAAPAAPPPPPQSSAGGDSRGAVDRGSLLDPASAYLAGLGPGSRRTMREALVKLAGWASDGRCDPHDLPWHLLRLEHTAALRTRLCATLAPATANKHMAALRGVLKQCWLQGRLSGDDYHRVIDLPPIRGASPRESVALRAEDFERIAQICAADESASGARDEALLVLLRGSSLRRAEAVALDFADYDAAAGAIAVRGPIRSAVRTVETPASVRRALDRWIRVRGREPGPLFNPVNKGGRIEKRRLSEQAIYIACQKRAKAAGLPKTSPEDLRRVHAEA